MATTRPRAAPALADLTQDIAGPLPVALLQDWTSGTRTKERALALLAPFRRDGTVGASDASGLSRLTQEKDLLEVVWMVAQPKQIVHALGTEIGGQAIGIWVADNTEMFYPERVAVDAVVDAMIEAQARIEERASVKIGICLHTGVFYEIGGGLYGPDAQIAEGLAEEHARAAEIIVTDETRQSLRAPRGPSPLAFERREDLDDLHAAGVYSLRTAQRFPDLREREGAYPHGLPPALVTMLASPEYRGHQEPVAVERFVVFLSRARSAHEPDDLAAILDDFVRDGLMRSVVSASVDATRHVAESGGGLAVLVFESGKDALDFARLVRERLHDNAIEVKIGIDRGPVLLFARAGGGYVGVAGDPVNMGSKISEDLGHPARINITDRAAARIGGLDGAARFGAKISGVTVSGFVV